MNVLFAASEATPVIKSGDLADMVGSLPKHLKALGVDVRIVLPDYAQLNPKLLAQAQPVANFDLELAQRTIQVGVRLATLPDTNIPIYFISLSQGLSVSSLYPTPKEKDQYRFPLFCRAVVAWLKIADWQPEIVHAHDWMTGLVPYLIQQQALPYKTVMTIHNIADQGITDRQNLIDAGVTPPTKAKTINQLKTGILYATKVNTVSPTYAKEVLTRQYGHHLEATMRARAKDFSGILNGVDYARYAPYTDKASRQDYTIKTVIESKIINKEMLRQEVGLKSQKQQPLFGIVARLDQQHGLNLVESLIRETPFMQHAQLVILGTGSKELERKLARLAKKYPGQLALILRIDQSLADRIYAACDFFMMPSQFEPCGLSQMITMKYGTLPIVRHTGGLADTVSDIAHNPAKGTGFVFNDFDYLALFQATKHALSLFDDKPSLYASIEQAMRQDFSWGKSARQYLDLYQSAIKTRRRTAKT